MALNTTAYLIRQARREGMEEAAKVADRVSDKLMREASRYHDAEEVDCDRYEAMESAASVASGVADRIRRKAKRLPQS